MVTEVKKGSMLLKSKYECAYCRRILTDTEYQLDHIWPKSRGGRTVESNLAISCQRCNKNKGDHVEWVDRFSGHTCRLYHPRIMKWENHFKKSHGDVKGITPIGRATAGLVFRSTPQFLPPDLQWDKIEAIYENQPIYYFLNHLRYRRLRNDFDTLYKQLITPISEIDISNEDNKIIKFAKDMLTLELYFTRSRVADVSKGIRYGEQLLKSNNLTDTQKYEIISTLSILYQQRATIRFKRGFHKLALVDQNIASSLYDQAHFKDNGKRKINNNPNILNRELRTHTLRSKYKKVDLSHAYIANLIHRLSDFDPYYATSHYSFLIDSILTSENYNHKNIEHLYDVTTKLLETEGYGTIADHAKLITLRRRWWVLHFILENKPNIEGLAADIKYWKSIEMFNEVRELESYLKRVYIDDNLRKDIMNIIENSQISS